MTPPTAGAPSELASGKLLLDEPAAHVARLTISRPERRGALDHEILDSLAETVGSLDARCLVLTGTDPMFSAGYDVGNLEGQEFERDAEALVAHPFHAAIEALEAYEYPVIAQINGHAIGGGLELALTADIRVAARGVKLCMPPAKLGLIYSHTGLKRFVEVCGVAHTSELFYTGRNVDSDRGAEIGLVNHVVEPDHLEMRTASMAAEIAANAPLSQSGNKRILRALRAERLPPEQERELVELRESCFRSEDFREGVRAFGEKRAPVWQGR
ncbi:MAG: enoyl-CoA hydratase/isomerase family protein [Actinomycetota bacterium]|nr:enoyl-CoA hydratase/isomerase family protein [Actinomycetota bacterium]